MAKQKGTEVDRRGPRCAGALQAWVSGVDPAEGAAPLAVGVATTDSPPAVPTSVSSKVAWTRRIRDRQVFRARTGITGVPTAVLIGPERTVIGFVSGVPSPITIQECLSWARHAPSGPVPLLVRREQGASPIVESLVAGIASSRE